MSEIIILHKLRAVITLNTDDSLIDILCVQINGQNTRYTIIHVVLLFHAAEYFSGKQIKSCTVFHFTRTHLTYLLLIYYSHLAFIINDCCRYTPAINYSTCTIHRNTLTWAVMSYAI